jgi:hypothetical protein
VYEDEGSEVNTPFEQDWDELGNELRGGEMNWFQDEEGSPIWGYMKRLDVLSGIGSYGVMLLGFDDVNNDWKLTNPVKMLKEEGSIPAPNKQEMAVNYERALKDKTFRPYRLTRNAEVQDVFGGEDDDIEDMSASQFDAKKQPLGDSKKKVRLTHIRVFGEPLTQAVQFESNPTSPRFGQPTMYSITLNDMRDQHGGTGMSSSTYQVHWTRVIHYCDQDHQVSSSEIFAPPRMRCSLNTLLGLRKIYHGDPEGYWKACVTIMSYETHPQLGGDVDVDIPSIRDMDEQMMNGLQRSVILSGMSLKNVAPQVTDPTPHIAVGIEAICIKIPCPIRVFKGSERGELASSQDDSQWNDTVQGRMKNTATPGIIVPFINRLISVGTLSRPNVGKKPKFQPKPPADPPSPAGGGGFGGKPAAPGGATPPAMAFGKKPKPFGGAANAFGDSEDTEEKQYPNVPKPPGKQGLGSKPPMEKTRGGYSVDWPDLNSLSDQEKATVGTTKTTGLAAYIAGGCSAMVPEHDYLTKYQGFTDEEADAMLEAAAELQEEKMAEQAEQADELGMDIEPPPGMVDPDAKEKEHEVELEKAKNGGGVPPQFAKGGAPKPPFLRNADGGITINDTAMIENWCNQHGGDTCKDGAKNEATKERLKKAKESLKGKKVDKDKVKGKVKEKVARHRGTPKNEREKMKDEKKTEKEAKDLKDSLPDFDKIGAKLDKEKAETKKADAKEYSKKSIFRKAWDALIGNASDAIAGNATDEDDEISEAITALIATAEEQAGRDLTDEEVDELVEEFFNE